MWVLNYCSRNWRHDITSVVAIFPLSDHFTRCLTLQLFTGNWPPYLGQTCNYVHNNWKQPGEFIYCGDLYGLCIRDITDMGYATDIWNGLRNRDISEMGCATETYLIWVTQQTYLIWVTQQTSNMGCTTQTYLIWATQQRHIWYGLRNRHIWYGLRNRHTWYGLHNTDISRLLASIRNFSPKRPYLLWSQPSLLLTGTGQFPRA
jgi:hypothetical protein